MDLALIKSQQFGNVQCDFYQDDTKEVWMTREQIGGALEYSDPSTAITKIHTRYKDRVDKYSTYTKLVGVEGGRSVTRGHVMYSARGIYEICRWSRQPKADAFYDMVYDLLEALRRGDMAIVSKRESRDRYQELEIKRMNAEARLLNARTRQAMLVLKSKDGKTLSPQSVELLEVNALEALTGSPIDYRPKVEGKFYSAQDIANEAGVSTNKVGRVANGNAIKTEEYGMTVLDKSRYSSKQVESFRYNENGRAKMLELLSKR